MDDEILWFYRSDKNPTILNDNEAEWIYYEEHSDKIECAYQQYLFALESEDYSEIPNLSWFNIENTNYKIDFVFKVQKDGEKQRLIGRFSGNVINNKGLKNLITSKNYIWYVDTGNDITTNIWAPFRIEENKKIELGFKSFCLSLGSSIYEGEHHRIDFNNFWMTNKNDQKTHKVSRRNECPENITRVDYFNNEMKPIKSQITTISEETIQNIQKDYFLTFKNIFCLCNNSNEHIKFYWRKVTDSIVLRYDQPQMNNSRETILQRLDDEEYQEMCELIKTEDLNEFEVKFKFKIPLQLMKRVSKSYWYFKYDDKNEEFWQQFDKEESNEIDLVYKHRFLIHQEEQIYYGEENQRKLIKFKENKYICLKNNEEKTIMRYNPKYKFADEITRIVVPEGLYKKVEKKLKSEKSTHKPIFYTNKYGPKTFNELVAEITLELKNESMFLNNINMFEAYHEKYLNNIKKVNFIRTIIKIYTEEGFVYRRVNKVLRDKQYDHFWKFKYYYFSLLYSLENVLKQKKTSECLFRGLKLGPEQLSFYMNQIKENDMILFNEFMSTTSDKNIALNYAGSGGLLFEIEVSNEAAIRIANIEEYSVFSHEKEVLLSSGSILKFCGKIEKKDDIPNIIKFSLVESNSKAFLYFISSYHNNTIDLKKVNMDFKSIESLFKGANKSPEIKKIHLTISDPYLLYILAKCLIESEHINCIIIERKEEIRNSKHINFTHKRSIKIELKNFYEQDYYIFMSEILQQTPKISNFFAHEIYEGAFNLMTNKFININTLTALELYRISKDTRECKVKSFLKTKNESISNIRYILNNNRSLIVLKLNILNKEELKIISNLLINNDTLKKIKLIYSEEGILSKKIIEVGKLKENLTICLQNFNTQIFNLFLSKYLTNENKINELKLSNNKLHFSSINILTVFLSQNDCLENLELVKCSILDNHFKAISKAVENIITLKTVNLQNNYLTNDIKSILDMIKEKSFKFNINHNNLDEFTPKSKFQKNPKICFKCIKTLKGHTDYVTSLIVLSDGKIVSGSADKTIKIWNPMDKYNCIRTLEGHNSNVCSLMRLKDDKIVSGSFDRTIKIWDPSDQFNCIFTLLGHTNYINTLIKLSDGKIVSGSGDKTIRIWDPSDNYKCITTLQGHKSIIKSLLKLSDDKIVSASGDKTIKIWDLNTNYEEKCIKTIQCHEKSINSILKLRDGNIVTASDDKLIKIWDPSDEFKCIKTLEGHENSIYSLKKLNNGQIISASSDRTIKIWDPNENYKLIITLKGHTDDIRSLLKLRGEKIASASSDRTIKIWDPNDEYNCIHYYKGHDNSIKSLINFRDGMIVSGSFDGKIKIWDLKNNFNCIQTINVHSSVNCLLRLSDDRIVCGTEDSKIKIFDEKSKSSELLGENNNGHSNAVNCLIKLSDGSIISGSSDKTIKIWDSNDNYKLVFTLKEHTDSVNSLLKIFNGKIVSASSDRSIKVWDSYDNYRSIETLNGHIDSVKALARQSDGKIVSASEDKTIKIWDPSDKYKCIFTINEHTSSVCSLIKLNNGNIVSGSFDTTIKIWDHNDQYKCIQTLNGHKSSVRSLTKLNDGKIVSGSGDMDFRIWEKLKNNLH